MDDNKITEPVHNGTLEVNTNEICRKVNDVRKYYIKPRKSERQKKYRILSHTQILAYNVYVRIQVDMCLQETMRAEEVLRSEGGQ